MDTARSIIQGSFEQIKIYAPGVTMNAADSARALSEMNKMLDQWSNNTLTCFANIEQSFAMVPNKNQYTIGTSGGADIVQTRPITILTGLGAAYLIDSNQNRYPINVIEQDQWNMISLLTEQTDLPDTLFYNPQFPLGIINIFPTPSSSYSVYFDSRMQLSDLADLDIAFSLPPGYMSAIQSNLSIRLWPFFKQGTPDAWLFELASQSLADVKRSNIRQSPAVYDSAIVSKAQSSYNIFTDNFNRGGNGG